MTATNARGTELPGEPLVGRGSALRVEGNGDPAGAGGVDADDDSRRDRRWVPRPAPARSSRGRRWLEACTRISWDSWRPRARPALGFALVVGLAFAWMWVGRSTPAPRAVAPRTTSVVSSTGAPAEPSVGVPRWIPTAIRATCAAREGADREVVIDCTPGRGVVQLRYRGFDSVAALRVAYDAASPRDGGAGPALCARGMGEERSWSVSATPTVSHGRYRCLLVEGRARLVWSSERSRVLATATRADGDLRSLYEWWTTVPGPTGR